MRHRINSGTASLRQPWILSKTAGGQRGCGQIDAVAHHPVAAAALASTPRRCAPGTLAAMLPLVPESLPPPGPSFLREQTVRVGDRALRAGMSRPTEAPDGWWLAILWVVDDSGVVAFRAVAPDAGPPPDPPLARLGPALSGALSGLVLEDAGRLQMRLGLIRPPDLDERPWLAPLAIRAAFRFEPARAAAMRPNELAETVLAGFRRAVEGLHRP